jgi:hypothetical protein
MSEPLIERSEVVALPFNVADIATVMLRIRDWLGEDDEEEEDDQG